MAQQPRQLDAHASPEAYFGARLRDLRVGRRWSQQELGRRLHVSGALIGKIEKAERRPGRELVAALEAVVEADGELQRIARQVWFAPPLGGAAPAGAAVGGPPRVPAWAEGIETLRRLADVYDAPGDGPVRPMDVLAVEVAEVVRLRLSSAYTQLLTVLPPLISELTRAVCAGGGVRQQRAAALLAQTWRAADALADKLGLYDLSARLIHLVDWAAQLSGSDLVEAAAGYVRAETFFASGQLVAGRQMLERAAGRLDPDASVGAAAQFGALHMRAAVVAAGAGLTDLVAAHLAEARSVAQRLPDGIWQGTAFGPSSVRIHQVSASVEMRDPQSAVAAVAGWAPPNSLPQERRSHFYVDLARAHLGLGDGDAALQSLSTARVIAPEHVRVHPSARQVLAEVASLSSRHAAAARRFSRP